MNREIKFRGLTEANNLMVFGDLIHTPENKKRIIWFKDKSSDGVLDYDSFNELVQPSTVGQFTGLHDKNEPIKNCIYEGDILSLEGIIIGNIHEERDLLEGKFNIVIPSITSKDWKSAYEIAMARGCVHA